MECISTFNLNIFKFKVNLNNITQFYNAILKKKTTRLLQFLQNT